MSDFKPTTPETQEMALKQSALALSEQVKIVLADKTRKGSDDVDRLTNLLTALDSYYIGK